ncbi:MAG: M48 family metalloprotease [Chromatiales bacterium]|nr:M48 family metalloprotease [Chromatiales bacterium]
MFSPQTSSKQLTMLVAILFLLSSLVSTVHAQNIQLPEMGDPSGSLITPVEERRLGQAFMRSIRNTKDVVTDPLTVSYVESLGSRLVTNSSQANQGFTFFLISDPQVNAFAGPGGYIGVYSGLVTTTQSESELASVLAHEIAHVTQKHLIRTYDAMNRMSLPAAALMLAALAVGAASKNPDAGIAAATGIQAGMIQRQINFTRAHEEEADRIGIQILADADFDSRAMPTFFSRMGKVNQIYDSGEIPEFLRTHPVTTNRMADAYARAEDYPYRQRADSLEYHLLRARLKVAEQVNPKEAVIAFSKALKEGRYRNELGQRYGLALALINSRDYQAAEKELKKLLQQRPEQIDFIVTNALLLQQTNRAREGLKKLQQALDQNPGSYPLSYYLAEGLISNDQPDQAIPVLEAQLKGRPDDVGLYRLLARAAGNAGKNSLGHQYLAEYYYHSGNLKSAQQQLEIALRNSNLSYYDNAKMAARLKEIKQEAQEQKERKQ